MFDIGRYWAKVTRQRLGETSTGKPQLIISFQILGKVNLNEPEGDLLRAPEGERSIYRVISDKTLDYVISDLDKLGWNGMSWAEFDEQHPKCCDIRGTELALFCNHKPKQVKNESTGEWVDTSEMREEWSIAQESTGPQVKPLDKAAVSKLDGMFGKALKNRQKPAQTPQKPPQATRKPVAQLTPDEVNAELGSSGGNDIPFGFFLAIALSSLSMFC
jgi:hypothetical protein